MTGWRPYWQWERDRDIIAAWPHYYIWQDEDGYPRCVDDWIHIVPGFLATLTWPA